MRWKKTLPATVAFLHGPVAGSGCSGNIFLCAQPVAGLLLRALCRERDLVPQKVREGDALALSAPWLEKALHPRHTAVSDEPAHTR
jgi:hypothetical protein